MRRGLIHWNPDELPLAALESRLGRLREALRGANLSGFVAYTNIARPAAVTFLTGFTPYWSEGLLFVPLEGEPLFATALSKRVGEWIATTLPVGRVVNTPRPAALIAGELARVKDARLGVLDFDDFPSGHAVALLEGAPGLELVDATGLFASVRRTPDAAETDLAARAAALANAAFDGVAVATSARAIMAAAERSLRLAGAEECYVTVAPDLTRGLLWQRADSAPDLTQHFAVRVSLAYKGVWTRAIRCFSSEPAVADAFRAADAVASQVVDEGPSSITGLAKSLRDTAGVTMSRWLCEAPSGGAPLAVVASSDEPAALPAACAAMTIEGVLASGMHWSFGAAPALERLSRAS